MDTILDLSKYHLQTTTTNPVSKDFISVKNFVGLLPPSQLIFCKNLKSVICGCNDTFAHLMGLGAGKNALGKRIIELTHTTRGKELEEAEKVVLESLTMVEDRRALHHYFNSLPVHIHCIGTAKIMPMYDDSEKPQGVFGFATRELYFVNPEDIFGFVNKHRINTLLQSKKYILSLDFGEISLSQREAACLLFLMKGKTAKGIAKELCISNRTVECFIMHIKEKMRCGLKSEMVSLAYERDFLKVVQQEFLLGSNLSKGVISHA